MIVWNLKRRMNIALSPVAGARNSASVVTCQPPITTVVRDRGGGYAKATAKALPTATRWLTGSA